MEIPVGKTYLAHAVFALWVIVIPALFLLIKLGWIDFGSVQALGMLGGMFVAIPAGLIAAYSALTVTVTLLRGRPVPRDMVLLPAGFLAGVVGGMSLNAIETRPWTVVAYLLAGSYVIMTSTLVVRHRLSLRRSARS